MVIYLHRFQIFINGFELVLLRCIFLYPYYQCHIINKNILLLSNVIRYQILIIWTAICSLQIFRWFKVCKILHCRQPYSLHISPFLDAAINSAYFNLNLISHNVHAILPEAHNKNSSHQFMESYITKVFMALDI